MSMHRPNHHFQDQWRGESEAAGGAALLMVPPLHLVWDPCHVVGTAWNDRQSLGNTFGWMGAPQAPQQFHGRVMVEAQGARLLATPKNLHLMVPKSGSNIAQQYVDSYAFLLDTQVKECKIISEKSLLTVWLAGWLAELSTLFPIS